jgi:hypothetical protein
LPETNDTPLESTTMEDETFAISLEKSPTPSLELLASPDAMTRMKAADAIAHNARVDLKLQLAAELGLAVVEVSRDTPRPGDESYQVVGDKNQLCKWVFDSHNAGFGLGEYEVTVGADADEADTWESTWEEDFDVPNLFVSIVRGE